MAVLVILGMKNVTVLPTTTCLSYVCVSVETQEIRETVLIREGLGVRSLVLVAVLPLCGMGGSVSLGSLLGGTVPICCLVIDPFPP